MTAFDWPARTSGRVGVMEPWHEGPFADKAAGPGTYKWKLDGDKVMFTKVKDKSEGRSGALTAGAWERKEE